MSVTREILGLKLRKVPRARLALPRTVATAAAIVLGLAAATGAAPGSAAKAGEATTYHLCLTNAASICMEANGKGKQVTISPYSNDYMDVHSSQLTATCKLSSGGQEYTCFQFSDGSGNCLQGAGSNVVQIASGGCSITNYADFWALTGSHTYKNLKYKDTLLTHGEVDGDNVYHATPGSGDWTQWSLIS